MYCLRGKSLSHGPLYIRKPERDATLPKITIAVLFLAAGFAMRYYARHMEGFADTYASVMNPFWLKTVGKVTGLVNFSVVEILIYLIILILLFHIASIIGSYRVKDSDRHKRFINFLTNLLILGTFIFLLYEAGEDVYFYRTPFSEANGFGAGSYSTTDLIRVCRYLTEECNDLADQVERDEDGLMVAASDVELRVPDAMTRLGRRYPMLAGEYYQPKPIFISYLMSKTGMAGIYSAYTVEANYNRDMTDYNKPFTMSHELTHTHGILQENEANFVAYLNCMNTNQSDIRYAGALSGWVYCGNELYKRNRSLWAILSNSLDPRVQADLAANNAFWKKYKGAVSKGAQSFNDSFLKNHGQTMGTDSYDQVVDLIVSYEMGRRSAQGKE